jgi:hypothetical protein
VLERCRALADEVRTGVARVDEEPDDPAVVDAVWNGEALGTLLWALDLVELPSYDEPFDHEELLDLELEPGTLRELEEIEQEREAARLWHWRARTAELVRDGSTELPERWESFDQLVAAIAMRGFEQGLLPAPVRGDFNAFGKVYRQLTADELSEAHSIAAERHHALAWLTGRARSWDDVTLDT